MAARGGLDGGEGRPEEGTSGIPLCPGRQRSAVVKALELRGRFINHVAAGKDVNGAGRSRSSGDGRSGNAAVATATAVTTITAI